MPRGGKRTGTAGKRYGNRSDLRTQAPKVKRGQEYGQAQQQEIAQRLQPLPRQSAPTTPPQVNVPAPGQVPSLSDPTAYPDRPVTHGLPIGPGAGPEVLGMDANDPALDTVRALYKRFPYPELRRMIERWGR